MEIFVSKLGNGFKTITDAVHSIPKDCKEPVTVKINAGVYKEQVVLKCTNITLIGENAETTIIQYGLYAKEIMDNNTPRGTFRTATLRTDGNMICLKNLSIKNTAGNGRDYGQAIALYAEGDFVTVENCRIIGHQDTLFTAPLPPVNKFGLNAGFGPKQNDPRKSSRQLYKDCFIQGDIDFIFGGAMALFQNCTIFSKNSATEEDNEGNHVKGYVTAPCTPKDQKYGYLFYQCMFLSDCPDNTVYLGRPWREYAKSVFIDCSFDSHIKAEGFHDWDNQNARKYSFFAESGNKTDGNNEDRVEWANCLTKEESENYINYFLEDLMSINPKI